MDTLKRYNKICEIRPHELVMPFIKPSSTKIQFNLKELELHYYEEFGAYLTKEQLDVYKGGTTFLNKNVKGGAEKKVMVALCDF